MIHINFETICLKDFKKLIRPFFTISLLVMLLGSNACTENKSIVEVEDIEGMIFIPEGNLNMGGDNEQASEDEFPKHQVKVSSFYMDVTEVTNRDFQKFTDETGYLTIAERPLDWEAISKDLPPGTPRPHDSIMQPGALVFTATNQPVPLDNPGRWWSWTVGASWRHPVGPDSDIKDIMDHPVVQVAWDDAKAYADWAGKRLPSEAEWEYAARGGMKDQIYPWGNEDVNTVGHKFANYWQGLFPYQNTEKDGYFLTASVKSFPANGYGLHDMAGNVWEWCEDWYDANYYTSEKAEAKDNLGPNRSFNPTNPYAPARVLRGGSFLCNDEYCSGYRSARRMQSSPDTGLNHTGFRCVKDVE